MNGDDENDNEDVKMSSQQGPSAQKASFRSFAVPESPSWSTNSYAMSKTSKVSPLYEKASEFLQLDEEADESEGDDDDDSSVSSSSSEESLTLEEKVPQNQQRNALFLQSLTEKYDGKAPESAHQKALRASDATVEEDCSDKYYVESKMSPKTRENEGYRMLLLYKG